MIQVQNLSKSYGDVTAVNNISLDIDDGELFGLLGPNGAGKSTFINMTAGLLHPDRGDITIKGHNYRKEAVTIKAMIGLVPQELSFYEAMSARENVGFFASLYGLRGAELKNAVRKALDFVGLSYTSKKQAKTFSGGMKRRLNIACGIAHDPEIIFFDEPTVGIDPQSRNHIHHSIKNLNTAGRTIIYTTHYMEEAEELCTRIAILDKGKIIAKGTNSELQTLVLDASRLIISVRNAAGLDLKALENIPGVRNVDADDTTIAVTSDVGIHNINQLVNTLDRQNVTVTDIRADVPSLETVFLNLTGRSLRD